MKNEQYAILANFYDRLNSDVDYKLWANFCCNIFEKYSEIPINIILDLACGTGSMSIALVEKGFDIIGIDLSSDMLSIAYNRAIEKGKNILFSNQNMCDFELYGTVDAVVCCLDSLNYLIKKDDLQKCFKNVHNYLNPNGLFIFDINTPHKFDTIYSNNSYIFDHDDVFCGWQNFYNKKSKICNFYLTIFVRNKECSFTRFEEIQKERAYSEKTVKSLLNESGFEIIDIVSDYNFTPHTNKDERWYFICKQIEIPT